jgi:glutathione S-transferase
VRLWEIPFSTNVERVQLGLAHKGLEVEHVMVDPADRSPIVRVSGQELVPVLEHDDVIVFDSERILRYVESLFPEPPLWPEDRARRAEVDVFVEWFNKVWKRPPNLIDAGEAASVHGPQITAWLDVFESLLGERDYLFGDFGIADVIAFPFLKYAGDENADDDEAFHQILRDWLPIEGHPGVKAWIHRVDALPRA